MTKSELISRIKRLAKATHSQRTNKPVEPSKFPIVDKFPPIKDVLNDLFDFQYEAFLKDIQWVAPRPSTFRVVLVNDGKLDNGSVVMLNKLMRQEANLDLY